MYFSDNEKKREESPSLLQRRVGIRPSGVMLDVSVFVFLSVFFEMYFSDLARCISQISLWFRNVAICRSGRERLDD